MSTQIMINNLAGTITSFVQGALAKLEWVPERVIHVAPGESVAWDDCCGGQLWGRLVSFEPSQATQGKRCFIPHFIARIEMGLIRCASTVDDAGNPPPVSAIEGEGLAGLADMLRMAEAITCNPAFRSLGEFRPRGPQGGCVGGTWEFTILVDNCLTCGG